MYKIVILIHYIRDRNSYVSTIEDKNDYLREVLCSTFVGDIGSM